MNLSEAFDAVLNYFNGNVDKTMRWFATKNPALGGASPTQMIRKGREKKLIKFIKTALEGNHP